jgi:hypothetical protein
MANAYHRAHAPLTLFDLPSQKYRTHYNVMGIHVTKRAAMEKSLKKYLRCCYCDLREFQLDSAFTNQLTPEGPIPSLLINTHCTIRYTRRAQKSNLPGDTKIQPDEMFEQPKISFFF